MRGRRLQLEPLADRAVPAVLADGTWHDETAVAEIGEVVEDPVIVEESIEDWVGDGEVGDPGEPISEELFVVDPLPEDWDGVEPLEYGIPIDPGEAIDGEVLEAEIVSGEIAPDLGDITGELPDGELPDDGILDDLFVDDSILKDVITDGEGPNVYFLPMSAAGGPEAFGGEADPAVCYMAPEGPIESASETEGPPPGDALDTTGLLPTEAPTPVAIAPAASEPVATAKVVETTSAPASPAVGKPTSATLSPDTVDATGLMDWLRPDAKNRKM